MTPPSKRYETVAAADLGAWLLQIAPSEPAYVLLQGYPFTGFAIWSAGGLELPVGFAAPTAADWKLYWDVRVFDGAQEWHCWRAQGKWRFRHARRRDWLPPNSMERTYALWGEKSETAGLFRTDTEDRDIEVWLPEAAVQGIAAPAGLRTLLRIEYEESTGLTGITDTMLLRFIDPRMIITGDETGLEQEQTA